MWLFTCIVSFFFFFFNDTATTEIYTLSLHDALPISQLEDGLLLFTLDVLARPVQQVLVLLASLRQQRGPLLLGHGARLRDQLLRLGARRRDQAFVLRQQASGLGAGPLRFLELLLDAALSLLHGLEEGGPAELPQQRQQDPEDDEGPEDQPRID